MRRGLSIVAVVMGCRSGPPPARPLGNVATQVASAPACMPIPAGTYTCDVAPTVEELVARVDRDPGRCTTGVADGAQTIELVQRDPGYTLRGTLHHRGGAVHLRGRVTCPGQACAYDVEGALEVTDVVVYIGSLAGADGQRLEIRLEHDKSAELQADPTWADDANLCR